MFNTTATLFLDKNNTYFTTKKNLKEANFQKIAGITEVEKLKQQLQKLFEENSVDDVNILLSESFCYLTTTVPQNISFDEQKTFLAKLVPEEKDEIYFYNYNKNTVVVASKIAQNLKILFESFNVTTNSISPIANILLNYLPVDNSSFLVINSNLELSITYFNKNEVLINKTTNKLNISNDFKSTLESIKSASLPSINSLYLTGPVKLKIKDVQNLNFDFDPIEAINKTKLHFVEEKKSKFQKYTKNLKKPSNVLIFGILLILILLILLIILLKK